MSLRILRTSNLNECRTNFCKSNIPQTMHNVEHRLNCDKHLENQYRFVLPTTEVQILHYSTTSIYENFLSLASLADMTCAVSSFVNFSPSPSMLQKSPTPEHSYLTNVTLEWQAGQRVTGWGRGRGGTAKLGSGVGRSMLHIHETGLLQHINCWHVWVRALRHRA
jgi:hypothetical protein